MWNLEVRHALKIVKTPTKNGHSLLTGVLARGFTCLGILLECLSQLQKAYQRKVAVLAPHRLHQFLEAGQACSLESWLTVCRFIYHSYQEDMQLNKEHISSGTRLKIAKYDYSAVLQEPSALLVKIQSVQCLYISFSTKESHQPTISFSLGSHSLTCIKSGRFKDFNKACSKDPCRILVIAW